MFQDVFANLSHFTQTWQQYVTGGENSSNLVKPTELVKLNSLQYTEYRTPS